MSLEKEIETLILDTARELAERIYEDVPEREELAMALKASVVMMFVTISCVKRGANEEEALRQYKELKDHIMGFKPDGGPLDDTAKFSQDVLKMVDKLFDEYAKS